MKLQRLSTRVRTALRDLLTAPRQIAELKVLVGSLHSELQRQRSDLADLRNAEFRVFSQFGEDGILQHLIRTVDLSVELKTFVEFGVEAYVEANTRFLLINDSFRGLVIDGSASNVRRIVESEDYWRYNLTAVSAFIDRDNINNLISEAGFSGEIGVLSVDIDGNDYWVWEAINTVNPVIVVCEYNSVFGSFHAVSVPYNETFVRSEGHYSNLYWGCSLSAWEYLANRKGYALVGSNSAGNNAFFVRRDRLNGIREVAAVDAWVESQFSESRDPEGNLTYLRGAARLELIRDLPVVDVTTGQIIKIGDLE